MDTVNERLRDAEVSHQVNLHGYANGVVRRIIALLNRTDVDLFAQLTAALERLTTDSFSVERLESLLQSVRNLNEQAYQSIGRELSEDMKRLADYESEYQHKLFDDTLPSDVTSRLPLARVDANQVYAAAMSRPFQGRLLREWTQSMETSRMVRVRDAVRIGFVEGQTIPQIVQRIRGTRANGYADGLLEVDRRGVESVVRTAVAHMAGTVRDAFIDANADIVKAEQWVSTLDTRTSPICRLRDGLEYTPKTHKPIGHKVPWLAGPGRSHWCCRSSSAPVTKSFRDLGIDIDEVSETTRASMDGQVPASQSYGEWLAKQSAARQDQILGPTRGALYRRGGVQLDRFYNDKGRFLTLDDLRARDAAAFRRAGV